MHKAQIVGVGLVAAAGAVGVALAGSSCAATPTNIPVRTFEQPKKVDVVCIAVNNAVDGGPLAASEIHGLAQNECAPAATDFAALNATSAATLPNHLYAVVTQTTRGELAVVDLTAGYVIDEDRSTPGTNFIPVGSGPTDVVVTPDGQMTFVSSADPNKPAIYGIPSGPHVAPGGGAGLAGALLGDSTGISPPLPLLITDLEACALPQAPEALAVAASGPVEAGAPRSYVLVAVLAGSPGVSAKVVAIDPSPLLRGAGVDAGSPDAAPATPGVLTACSILGATALSTAMPASWHPGPAWADGVTYADAGSLAAQEPSAGPSCGTPTVGGDAAPVAADGPVADDAGAGPADDAGSAAGDAGVFGDAGAALEAGTFPLSVSTLGQPFPTNAVLRDDLPILYVSGGALPVIHEIDLTDPANPRELPPLLATSVAQPTRPVSVGAIAISPTTRDYKRYLYAVDSGNGTLMVFDVTDPALSPHTPLERPHAELNPLLPADRLAFSAPVATVGFVQHDWPLIPPGPNGTPNPDQIHAYEGLLCNPNPNAHPDAGTFRDLGAYYRVDQATAVQSTGVVSTVEGFPYRLRGVFGFATLSSGQVVAIDVDDWDAPCRRPEPMTGGGTGPSFGMTGLLDIPEPSAGPLDLDPYHAPITYQRSIPESPAVTQEEFFPVSAPHRIRSNYLLRNDVTSGIHIPNLLGAPQLFDAVGAPVPVSGTQPPLILPTALPAGFIDPTLISNPSEADPSAQTPLPAPATVPSSKAVASVRLSFDDPTVTTNQDWTVTYEGALPVAQQSPADILTTDGDQTLLVSIGTEAADGGIQGSGFPASTNGPGFCERGIEDWSIGQSRAAAAETAMKGFASGIPNQVPLDQWTSDYIEVTDQILPQGDPYWSVPFKDAAGGEVNDCWQGTGYENDGDPNIGGKRYNACQETFGAPSSCPGNGMSLTQTSACQNGSTPADPDTFLTRDFPILHAFDDHLVVGRFGWQPGSASNHVPESTGNRVVVGPDASNVPFLRLMRCCFHHQAAFKVRAGGEWVTVGQTGLGFLHHVTAAPQGTDPSNPSSRPCVLSCNPNDVLLNSRSFDVPACPVPANFTGIPRTGALSVLAMENPFLSFVTWSGCGTAAAGEHTLTARDLTWKFSVRGGFTPLTVSINGNTATSVSPQSMRFIESFGQLAIVDGESQGLVLIDLNTLAFAHNPYY
jgi:hypothetical protein